MTVLGEIWVWIDVLAILIPQYIDVNSRCRHRIEISPNNRRVLEYIFHILNEMEAS